MPGPTEHDRPAPVPFRTALRFWFKLGCIGFGGPAGQIAIMHQELVERRRWISERRFLHALNYCMLLPGPEAQQLATYMGWLMHRTPGGIAAGGLFVLPSLVLLVALSCAHAAYGHVAWMAGLFYGIKPAVLALVAHAGWRIGRRTLRNTPLALLAALALGAILVGVPFPLLVGGAALLGWLGGRLLPEAFAPAPPTPRAEGGPHAPAWIDDHTPPPPHARFRWSRLAALLAAGALLWALPMGLLAFSLGWDHTLTRMSWFFTKAALLSFGGAYAVLPYVYQGAVTAYGWISPRQMMDGLALGETTPGPLVMVVVFVAFTGGWHSEEARALFAGPGGGGAFPADLAAGLAAALLTAWFTFLPSFLFILAGGPAVESTHGNLRITSPLAAVSAAVVGVIGSLALFFGKHVLWPEGMGAGIDWAAAALAALGAVALFRFRRSAVEVIAACGLAGLVLRA